MKKGFLSIIIWLVVINNLLGQTVAYTRQMAHVRAQDAVQLIANIAGHHHLLVLRPKQNPVLYIYNQALSLQTQVQLPFILNDNEDIRVFSLKDYYYVFAYQPMANIYRLWKVDALGNCVELSEPLRHVMVQKMRGPGGTFKLSIAGDKLYIISHTYYEDFKKVLTTLVQVDSSINPVTVRHVSYDYDREAEKLQQVMLMDDNNLLVTKTATDNEGHLLKVLKVNIETGEITTTFFNIGSRMFLQPTLSYNPANATMFIYAKVREPIGGYNMKLYVLMTRLDAELKQLMPATLHQMSALNQCLLIDDSASRWVCLYNAYRSVNRSMTYNNSTRNSFFNAMPEDMPYLFPSTQRSGYLNNYLYSNNYPPIKFSILNKKFRSIDDSVIKNDKKSPSVQPGDNAEFIWKNKSYLLFKQQFTAKAKGLLLLYGDDNKKIASKDIPVYEQYDYKLSQLQQLPDQSVIMPFTYKQEAGLIKLQDDSF